MNAMNDWRTQDTLEAREIARALRYVWSTRTRQWLSPAAMAEENRVAANVWAERKERADALAWWR